MSTSLHMLYGVYTEKLTIGRSEEVWTVCVEWKGVGDRRRKMKKSDNRGMSKGIARDNNRRTG